MREDDQPVNGIDNARCMVLRPSVGILCVVTRAEMIHVVYLDTLSSR